MNKFFLTLAVLALSALSLTSAATTCPPVVCTLDNLNPANLTGVATLCSKRVTTPNGDNILVSTCNNKDLWCYGAAALINQPAGASGNCLFKPSTDIHIGSVLPGDSCLNTLQCITGSTCTNSLCVGTQLNGTCTVDANCGVGFFCGQITVNTVVKSACVPVVPSGGQCGGNLAKCGYGQVCANLVCTKYLSQPIGATVGMAGQTTPSFAACASLTTAVNGNSIICAAAPKLVNGSQLVNSTNYQCQYQAPGATQPLADTVQATCQFSQTGMAVCPLGVGDLSTQFTYIYNNFFKNDLSKICHLSESIGTICDNARLTLSTSALLQAYMSVYGNELDPTEASADVDTTAYLVDNADCVKKEVTYAYWSAIDSASVLTAGATFLVWLVASMF